MLLLAGCSAAGCAQVPATRAPLLQLQMLPMPGPGGERAVRVLLPPSYAASPQRCYPAIYLHDGQNLFDAVSAPGRSKALTDRSAQREGGLISAPHGGWGVPETMAALARETGFEAIVIGIDHGGERRIAEMLPWPQPPRFMQADGDGFADFVVRTVKPFVDARWRTHAGDATLNAIGGSSLGAVIAQHTLLRHPRAFGKALLFSPAYWLTPMLFDAATRTPLPPSSRVCLYAGGAESETMLPLARRMHALLAQQPRIAVTLQEAPAAAHDERAWRAALPGALRWLFEIS